MRFIAIILVTIVICSFGFGQNRALVDFEADVARPIKIGDSTVYSLVGNVVFHHNGAVILCDSAIRYSDRMMECYNNIIINKDSTFIYGDRADYNGVTNLANVYSPLVKLVDKDMVMYSYDLDFNTLTSVGRYTRGGTILQKDNIMESVKAEYHAKTREIFFVDRVAMKNDQYTIETDSMSYAFDPEITTFHRKAKIWTKDGDFLTADKGKYFRLEDKYVFTNNSYVLTKDQQMWADSITYIKSKETSYLNNNIQILDEKQSLLAFGDYAIYWGTPQDALLTKNPSIIGFDPKQSADSVYIRADTLFIYTIPVPKDSLAVDSLAVDSIAHVNPLLGLAPGGLLNVPDSPLMPDLPHMPDSLAVDIPVLPKVAEPKDLNGEEKIVSAQSAATPKSPKPAPSLRPKTKSELRREEKQNKIAEARKKAAQTEEGAIKPLPNATNNEAKSDSLPTKLDSLKSIHVPVKIDTIKRDTIQRIIKGYYNVKVFRNDMQAVCDSLVGFSLDSTLHLYINPVLWSDSSQVTSEYMHVFSKNEQLSRAEFEGAPIMSQQVTDSLYNQIAGRIMYAYFKENNIDKLDVEGNAQTYYYMRDDKTKEIGSFLAAESANMTFVFDSSRVSTITYREDVSYKLYPIDKIPDSQPQTMKGFKWEEERRPKSRLEVFDRTIHPSKREESTNIPKPSFYMTQRIETYKAQMIRDGIWRDRSDKLWINSDYFQNEFF